MKTTTQNSCGCTMEFELPLGTDVVSGPEVETEDRYSAGIELSNACREFYHNRQKTAEEVKLRLSKSSQKTDNNGIDKAMDRLRKEMASLMDLDLSLMKQLLTMNDAIEELKFQQDFRQRHSTDSLEMEGSDWSVSETDMYGSDDDLFEKCPVADQDFGSEVKGHTSIKTINSTNDILKTFKLAETFIPEPNSFDSGIYGPS